MNQEKRVEIYKEMAKKNIIDPVILFEPNSYYQDSLHMDLHLPEPVVFYYYTGLRSVWTNSPAVGKATYLARIRKGEVRMEHITTPGQLQSILKRYQAFTPIL